MLQNNNSNTSEVAVFSSLSFGYTVIPNIIRENKLFFFYSRIRSMACFGYYKFELLHGKRNHQSKYNARKEIFTRYNKIFEKKSPLNRDLSIRIISFTLTFIFL
jgi:hypothetical protein